MVTTTIWRSFDRFLVLLSDSFNAIALRRARKRGIEASGLTAISHETCSNVGVAAVMLSVAIISTSLLFLLSFDCLTCMHVTGTWSTSRFGTAVARFGYDAGDDGFLYGNVTVTGLIFNTATLVFVSDDYYNSKTELYQGVHGRTKNCTAMMKPLAEVSLMPVKNCTNPHLINPKDFLRSVPCKEGKSCPSPDWNVTGPVVPGSQFTFRVATSSPKDWFALLLGCSISPVRANTTKNDTWKQCVWEKVPNIIPVEYDLWLVNGDPNGSRNFFTFQFSFELQGVLQMAIVFLGLFTGLGVIHLFGVIVLKAPGHTLIRLYTASLLSEILGITFHFIHYMIYAKDGVGIVSLRDIGDFCVVVTQCLFMLLLLLIAKGWTITTVYLTNKKYVAGLWITYVILNIVLFIVNTVVSNLSYYCVTGLL